MGMKAGFSKKEKKTISERLLLLYRDSQNIGEWEKHHSTGSAEMRGTHKKVYNFTLEERSYRGQGSRKSLVTNPNEKPLTEIPLGQSNAAHTTEKGEQREVRTSGRETLLPGRQKPNRRPGSSPNLTTRHLGIGKGKANITRGLSENRTSKTDAQRIKRPVNQNVRGYLKNGSTPEEERPCWLKWGSEQNNGKNESIA